MPGDAFQRSQARVKTSIIILEKREPNETQEQGPIFKYACRFIGVDDPKRQRTLPVDVVNRRMAKEEVEFVAALYRKFINGEPISNEYVIAAERVGGRLDVKSFQATGLMHATWVNAGLQTETLRNILQPVDPVGNDVIDTSTSEEKVTYLVVGYDGFARSGETILATDHRSSANLYKVHAGQIVLSNINAVHGSICVVPDYLDGLVVTNKFTVFDVSDEYDARIVWALLRSPEIRSELLVKASGAGRTRVKWATIADVCVPIPGLDLAQAIIADLRKAEDEILAAQKLRKDAQARIEAALSLATTAAVASLAAFKPPR